MNFSVSPSQSCQILYQFLFNDHVLFTSNILIPLFQSTLSSTHQCIFVISCHFYLLLLSQICIVQFVIHVPMQFWIMSHSFNLQLFQSLIFILFLSIISIPSSFLFNSHQFQFICCFIHHLFH